MVHDVTWIEAQIACPIFSGLVTYYIEGDFSQKHHLMEAVVGKPESLRSSRESFLLHVTLGMDPGEVCFFFRGENQYALKWFD
mgnify:CR=1 FL=1